MHSVVHNNIHNNTFLFFYEHVFVYAWMPEYTLICAFVHAYVILSMCGVKFLTSPVPGL